MTRDDRTPDLLSWQSTPTSHGYAPEEVRAVSFDVTLCRAISAALRDCGRSRDDVAAEMSTFLNERVSKAMLDAYASPGRKDHVINVPRLFALIHATGDARLLGLLPEAFGKVVIDRKYLPWIELAQIEEERAALDRRASQVRRSARRTGL